MFTSEILPAICRTFLHSIWQGLLAAIIAGAVLALTRRSSARRRYNLLGGILVLCVLAAFATLATELRSVQEPVSIPASAANVSAAAPATLATAGYWDILVNYLNTHAPFIMLVWGIVFLFKCFRMGMGFYHIHHIRRHQVYEPDESWKARMGELATLLGIRRAVKMVESGLVQVPLTAGFLKPCIFIPLGLLARLPADQVEAVLLHELAHIRRKDYLVNIVQSFVESIFFFNPALLWISARLREEREACCDDIALAHTPHQGSYLQALVAFAAHTPAGRLEMAITHKKHHLLNRVKRMLTRENQKLGIMEKSILIIGLVAISAFSMISELPAVPPAQEATGQPFVIYKPVADKVLPPLATVQNRDTVVPGKQVSTSQLNYSYQLDTTLHFDMSLLQDSMPINAVFNYTPGNQLKQYELNYHANTVFFTETDATVQLKIDSSSMFNLKEDKQFDYSFKYEYQLDSTQFSKNFNFNLDTTQPVLKKDQRKPSKGKGDLTDSSRQKGAQIYYRQVTDQYPKKGNWKSYPSDSSRPKLAYKIDRKSYKLDKVYYQKPAIKYKKAPAGWEAKPVPRKYKTAPADSGTKPQPKVQKPAPRPLEEKLPASFYNSLILPKQIDC
ncbi:M56 family metallopeptidase [Chitinophaga alhagiae]|uniref:M56 family metallopeptidase n=1 Tax=Chitinophaga alhagiae TaxID=2203219 RepID=UPI000E5C1838|nr:M56 family metallopeptidase [Chitinophaga alhagiae]